MLSLKASLPINLGLLLSVGMLLLGEVVFVLWQKSAIQAEVVSSRLLLKQMGNIKITNLDQAGFEKNFSESGLICLVAGSQLQNLQWLSPECHDPKELLSLFEKSIRSGREQVSYSNKIWSGLMPTPSVLHIVVPVEGMQIMLGASRSLIPAFEKVAQGRRIALAYLIINVIILTTIGFFRMVTLVIRPIDQLVERADSFSDEIAPFLSGSKQGEFSQLSLSLNQMLSKIDEDRLVLQENVQSLQAANEELQRNRREMIRAEKLASVGRLSAGLAHEIGNPLGIVQGYLELLARSGLPEQERGEYSKRAIGELNRINGLIRQLLDFSRSTDIETERICVHSIVQEVVDMIRLKKEMAPITFSVDLCAENDTVCADGNSLHQVFRNCVLNSADALDGQQESVGPHITLSSRNESSKDRGAELIIEICDNGPGVPAEFIDNVFDPFFTTKEAGRGTGLGLAVSYSLVEKFGGTIEMKSEAGSGASVHIHLPLDNV